MSPSNSLKVGRKKRLFLKQRTTTKKKSVRNHSRFREEAHIIEASLTRRFRSFVCSRRVIKSARYAFALAFPSSAGRASSRARGFASSFSFFFPTLKQISKRPNRCFVAFSSIAWRNLFRASAPLRTKKKRKRAAASSVVAFSSFENGNDDGDARARVRGLDVLFLRLFFSFPRVFPTLDG